MRLVNPLPMALAHYERALADTLEAGGVGVAAVDRPSIEQPKGHRFAEVRGLVSALVASRMTSDPTVVLWPSLGYLEVLMEAGISPQNHIVFHDPQPMRSQFGLRRWQGRFAAPIVRHRGPHIIVHTQAAAEVLIDLGWPTPTLLPHPLRSRATRAQVERRPTRNRCLVMGQYKPSRSLAAIAGLPALLPDWSFRIVGRGWPALPGFDVHSEFVSEVRFEMELRDADVVLIPYERFFQSGVMVRAVEVGRPVVAVDHEQTRGLYGDDWPGIVSRWDAASVAAGIIAAAEVMPDCLIARYALARNEAAAAWGSNFQNV